MWGILGRYRQPRSTVWTRWTGAAAFISVLGALGEKMLHYFEPSPRWDILIPLMASTFFAVGWVIASLRAPQVPRPEPGAVNDIVWLPEPALPRRLPGFGVLRNYLYPIAQGYLIVLAFACMYTTAIQPHGAYGHRMAEIEAAGGIVGPVTVVALPRNVQSIGDEQSGYQYTSDVVVAIRFESGERDTTVIGARTSEEPYPGATVNAFYAPGRPDLGANIHLANAGSYTGRPIGRWALLIALLLVGAFVSVATCAAAYGDSPGTDATLAPLRRLRRAVAENKACAARAAVVGSVRERYASAGFLEIVVRGRGRWRVSVVRRVDPSVVADDFAGVQGWLFWPRDWESFGNERGIALAFASDDGRVLWCCVTRSGGEQFLPANGGEPPSGPRLEPRLEPRPEPRPDPGRRRLRLVRYARFHPVLHGPAAIALVVGAGAVLPSLIGYPPSFVAWFAFFVATPIPVVAACYASRIQLSATRAKRLLAGVPIMVEPVVVVVTDARPEEGPPAGTQSGDAAPAVAPSRTTADP